MIRTLLRRSFRLGVLSGLGYGLWKTLRSRFGADNWQSEWAPTGPPGATTPSPSPASAGGRTASGRGNGEAHPIPVPEDPADTNGKGGTDAVEGVTPRSPAPPRPPSKPRTAPARKAPSESPGERMWVAANEGVCPPSHPIKAKLSSKIFHSPGSRNYSRTRADRCYPDAASAQADGLRPALR